VAVDGIREVLARTDPAVMPGLDDALTLKHCQLSLDLVAQRLVICE